MNTDINHQQIQIALARLIINPHYLLSNAISDENFWKNFNLSSVEQQELKNFFQINKKKFIASAMILKKRRIDSIMKTFYLFIKGFNLERIKAFFDHYFTSLCVMDKQPMNPYIEAIRFFQFLLEHENLSTKEQAMIEYDMTRTLAKIKYAENQFNDVKSAQFLYKQKNIFISPLIISKSFDVKITDLMASLNKRQDLRIDKTNSYIVFYYHVTKKLIAVLSVKSDFLRFIAMLQEAKSQQEICETVLISDEIFAEYLLTAEMNGLIYFDLKIKK